jgi:hypothetical protein
MRLRLMGALSLTRRKPRGRSGLHSTPFIASTVLTLRLAPAWGLARTVPGVVPPVLHARFPLVPTSGVRSQVIYPCPTLGFPASTHVICCNNPRDKVARPKKRNLLRDCAVPQQLCETCRCGKRAQISELEHIILVRGPQSQCKSSSADVPVCKDRERKQCDLSSYCADLQPLCIASCGCKCARKWHFHGNSHTCHAASAGEYMEV